MMSSLQRSGAVLTAVLLLAACGRGALPPEPARSVLTTVLGAQAGSDTPSYSGEVRSRYETQLAFRVAGKISERLVDAGAQVKAGDVLARLDPVDMALTAASAKAELELAEADVRRYRELRAKNFVSQAALDGKETALKANKAKADLAGNQSAYATLRADQSGVVSQVVAEVGQVVSPGQVVMRMARTDALAVEGLESALERAAACVEAGADMVFPEAITELEMYKLFANRVKAPILANITEFGATPLYTTEQLAGADVSLVLYPLSAFRAMNKAAENVYTAIRRDGTQQNVIDTMQTRMELYDAINYHEFEQKLDALFAAKK